MKKLEKHLTVDLSQTQKLSKNNIGLKMDRNLMENGKEDSVMARV
jgi:hypothetical protein